MKYLSPVLVAVIILCSVPARAAAQGSRPAQTRPATEETPARWQEFVSEEGGFSVMIPGRFTETRERLNTPAGPVLMRTFQLQTANATYHVMYGDYSAQANDRETMRRVYDGGRDAVLDSPNVRLVSEMELRVDGVLGRELVLEWAETLMRGRYVMMGRRFYQVMVAVPRNRNLPARNTSQLEAEINKYLNSFKIMPQPNPAAI